MGKTQAIATMQLILWDDGEFTTSATAVNLEACPWIAHRPCGSFNVKGVAEWLNEMTVEIAREKDAHKEREDFLNKLKEPLTEKGGDL